MNKVYFWYFVYEIIYTLLWLSFIAFLVYHFDNPDYLWLLLVMIFGGIYIKDKKEVESNVKEIDHGNHL